MNGNEPLEHFIARQLAPSISFRFEELTVHGFRLVILRVPAAIKVPTSYDHERWIRIGSSKERLSKYPEREADLWEILKQGLPTMANTASEYQDLSFGKLFSYYALKGHPLREETFKGNLHLLTEGGKYNLIAKLLADNGHVSIKAGVYRGKSKAGTLYSVKEFGNTCLLYAADAILAYGDVMNVMQADEEHRVAGRKEVPLFDPDAYREAVLNALIHNKWVLGDSPMFEFYSDRIEIRSFGTMPPNQTYVGFYRGDSKPVNKELSEVFSTLGISDRLGRGVPKIVAPYGERAITFAEDSILITIPFAKIGPEAERSFVGETIGKAAELESLGLNLSQQAILRAMAENRNVTVPALMAKIHLSKAGIMKNVRILKDKGFVERIGSSRVGYWKVLVDQK